MLVTGGVSAGAHERCCDRHLGDDDAAVPRRRVAVRPGPNAVYGATPPDADIVAGEVSARSVSPAAPDPARVTRAETVSALAGNAADAITRVSPETAAPVALRVCVDALDTFVEAHSERTAFRLCHVLNGLVRERRGMLHAHLPRPAESSTVRLFEPLFDVRVDLRTREGRVEQRWTVLEDDLATDWLPV